MNCNPSREFPNTFNWMDLIRGYTEVETLFKIFLSISYVKVYAV
jgi:hypothetical protein